MQEGTVINQLGCRVVCPQGDLLQLLAGLSAEPNTTED